MAAPHSSSSEALQTFVDARAATLAGDWSDLELMAEMTLHADRFVTALSQGYDGIALIAVGGYGRREVGPHSDLDIVLIHAPRVDAASISERIWYPIWDAQIGLDYSVRTIADAMSVAASDPRALLGLLDARLVCGDQSLYENLRDRVNQHFAKKLAHYRSVMRAQTESRRREAGELAFLLEPDIKESHGGLRDLLVARHFAAFDPNRGFGPADFTEATNLLLGVRNILQSVAGRPQNRLALQDQDQVAEVLGFGDADKLMFRIAETGRHISRSLEELYRAPAAGRKRQKKVVDDWIEVPAGVHAHGKEICVDSSALAGKDASVALKLAALSLSAGFALCPDALQACADHLGPVEGEWEPQLLQSLVAVMSYGSDSVALMERLDHYGILDKLWPEWKAVRYLPQRNAYHTFTVDRHLIEAGVGAAQLRRRVKRPDLLVVSALLHDLGKGYDGDHSAVGADVASSVAARMGLSSSDVEVVTRLVRHHLLLADTATRRDVSDPKTISMVAEAVVDETTLELLKVLTEADSKATGPVAWSKWKDELINRLCDAVLAYLRGEKVDSTPSFPDAYGRSLIEKFSGKLQVIPGPDETWVVAPDQVGLFSKVAGALASLGIKIIDADVYSTEGIALERFHVMPAHGRDINWGRFGLELEKVLSDGGDYLERRLRDRSATSDRRRKVAESAKITPLVTIHPDASVRAVVIEICGPDSVGLLHRLTAIFASHGMDIAHAKVITIGDDVVDTFYVTSASRESPPEPDELDDLRKDLEAAVSSTAAG